MSAQTPVIDDESWEEALNELEANFGVKLETTDIDRASTFGEAFDAMAWQLPLGGKRKCATAMAFYKLRAILPDDDITPATRLDDVNSLRYDRIEHVLRKQGWKPPLRDVRPAVTLIALPAAFIICLTMSAVLSALGIPPGFSVVAALTAFLLPSGLHHFVFRNTRPSGADTVGDLARLYAVKNIRQIHKAGGGFSRIMLWRWLELKVGRSCQHLTSQAIIR